MKALNLTAFIVVLLCLAVGLTLGYTGHSDGAATAYSFGCGWSLWRHWSNWRSAP